ncbi:MAG: hypothetical protein QW783_04080 [Candidatus Micrarchaeia archaeon]
MCLESFKLWNEKQYIYLIVAITAFQMFLILLGFLPPLSTGGLLNALFNLIIFALLFLLGYLFSQKGLKHAAKMGGLAMVLSVIIAYIALFIGRLFGKSVLGLPTPSDAMLLIQLFILLVVNVIIGAVVAVAGSLVGNIFKPKQGKRKSK